MTRDIPVRVFSPPVPAGFSIPAGQVVLLGALVSSGLALIFATVEEAVRSTALLYVCVAPVGLLQCHLTQRSLGDRKLRWLGYFWLVKLALTLFLLYAGWIPQLDPSTSDSWGYDPQRFYGDAYNLIKNNWVPPVATNYQGIIYYYGVVFYVFGHNPVAPALINCFVTLLGTLFLIRVAYHLKGWRGPRDWTLAFALLVPEVVWFDVMTSRETLAAVLILVSSLCAGSCLVGSNRIPLTRAVLLTGVCLLGIAAVRTTMLIAVVAAMGLMALIFRRRRGNGAVSRVIFVGLAVAVLVTGPVVQRLAGGYKVEYLEKVQKSTSYDERAGKGLGWSDRSIGLLLAPDSPWEAVAYTPLRMIPYLTAPLPSINVSVSDLYAGKCCAWQGLLTLLSSIINVVAVPYALAGLSHAYQNRRDHPGPLVLHLCYWTTFAAVVGGNIVIHLRYRVMATLLLFACAWLGYTSAGRAQVRNWFFLSYGVLGVAATLCVMYKFA